jgi:hypothetical protein
MLTPASHHALLSQLPPVTTDRGLMLTFKTPAGYTVQLCNSECSCCWVHLPQPHRVKKMPFAERRTTFVSLGQGNCNMPSGSLQPDLRSLVLHSRHWASPGSGELFAVLVAQCRKTHGIAPMQAQQMLLPTAEQEGAQIVDPSLPLRVPSSAFPSDCRAAREQYEGARCGLERNTRTQNCRANVTGNETHRNIAARMCLWAATVTPGIHIKLWHTCIRALNIVLMTNFFALQQVHHMTPATPCCFACCCCCCAQAHNLFMLLTCFALHTYQTKGYS